MIRLREIFSAVCKVTTIQCTYVALHDSPVVLENIAPKSPRVLQVDNVPLDKCWKMISIDF